MNLKNGFSCISSFLLILLSLHLSSNPSFSDPVPTITANNGTQRVLVMPNLLLDVIIELNPGGDSGRSADWWLLADTPMGRFHYDLNSGWQPDWQVTFQGPVATLPPFNVLSLAGLPAGTYYIGFGIDLHMNGLFDNDTYLDLVEVTVPVYSCPDTANSLDALSEAQKAFIVSRGNPELFILGLISEELDESNRAAYNANGDIRRLEYWLYNRDQLTMATFDSGHFVEETTVGDSIDGLQATPFSPSQFSPCMGQADIVELLGEPSCIQQETRAGRSYDYLRYNPSIDRPAATLVLENDVLFTVLAGYSFDLDSSPTDGNLCTDAD